MSYNQAVYNIIAFNNRFYLENEEQIEIDKDSEKHPRKDE